MARRRPGRHNRRIPEKVKQAVSSSPKPPPQLARLYARPGFLLRRAHQISAAVFEDACRGLELTPAQFGVLTVLQAHPGLGQSSLARALGFDKVTVLRVLRGLQSRGLVRRLPSEDNRRNVSVTLTAEGAELLQRAQKPAEKAYRRLMAPLDRGQQEQLLELLQLLTGGLEEEARAAFVPPPAPRQAA
jgi:MarR family transcriptional regulator, lower aerobic nicotinate degradation pathway regulator